ncbi:unnamed protein product [Closterium sp. NIES-54]
MRRLSRCLSLHIALLLAASLGVAAQNITSPDAPVNALAPAADVRPVSASAVGMMGDEEGFYLEETPAIKQLVARLERIAGSIKNPWEVLLYLNELFATSPSGGGGSATMGAGTVSPLADGCPATAAQMTKEVSRLAWRLHFRPIKYLLLAPLYNIINGTYHFDRLRRLPHGTTMPTFIPDYPIAKYFTPITPLVLITFGGSIVAVGTPGAKTIFARLAWAQIKDRDIHCGKYLAAHGVSTMVIPRVKLNN